MTLNSLKEMQVLYNSIEPWAGVVPSGFVADFLGGLTAVENYAAYMSPEEFKTIFGFEMNEAGGGFVQTTTPQIRSRANAETWFEGINWLIAAQRAREKFVMVTLGASYGAQAVGSWRALHTLNPLPCKLVMVDPVPQNIERLEQHLHNNNIEPENHWILPIAISDTTAPVLFPVGAPGSGSQNGFSTNNEEERMNYFKASVTQNSAVEMLESLLTSNSTNIRRTLPTGRQDHVVEIKYVSSITLNELLAPFEKVDFLESDIQESEKIVFPKFMDALTKKVRRVHIGTHGRQTHALLREKLIDAGWVLIFDYAPEMAHQSDLGEFWVNDGILTATNPSL